MLLTKLILSLPFQTVTPHFEEYVKPEVQQMSPLSYVTYLKHSSPHYLLVSS